MDVRRTPNKEPEYFTKIKDFCDRKVCSAIFGVTENEEIKEVEDGVVFKECQYYPTKERWRAKVKFK